MVATKSATPRFALVVLFCSGPQMPLAARITMSLMAYVMLPSPLQPLLLLATLSQPITGPAVTEILSVIG